MHKINDVFDKVYLLNLERDVDKYEVVKKKLDSLNIEFEVFKAIDGHKLNCSLLKHGNKGAVGCKMSYMQMFKNAKENNYSRILILEDDIFFLNDFINQFDVLYGDLLKIDENWKLLYFGGSNRTGQNHINFPKSKDKIQLIGNRFIASTYAIGYDSSIYDKILESENDKRAIDVIIGNDIKTNNYIFFPYLIYADVSKPSTTTDNNNKNQDFYCKLNYINKTNYF
jgi:hypothetical protein